MWFWQADKIHVTVKNDELITWKLILKENQTYMMHNFKVVNNERQYKVCLHPYTLVFTCVTAVIEQEMDYIPLKSFEFVNFADIISETYH